MPRPSGSGIYNINAATADLFYDRRIDVRTLIFIRELMPMFNVRAQVFENLAIEVPAERITQACAVGQRGNVAILVRPLVHCKCMYIAARNIVAIDHFSDSLVCAWPLVWKNHCQTCIVNIAQINAVEYIQNH